MIKMRSNTATKIPKPPPPVPPRPSKNAVAEALAKTKKINNNNRPCVPLRTAPPPPQSKSHEQNIYENKPVPIAKSQSHNTVNVLSRPSLGRSVSQDEPKKSRTVIFESANMKTSTIEVQLTRKQSDKRTTKGEVVKRTDSLKHITPNGHPILDSDHQQQQQQVDKNWNEILNDRNHVNTLIDEMFASVLNSHDDKSQIVNENLYANTADLNQGDIAVSSDKTKITVHNYDDDGVNNNNNKNAMVTTEEEPKATVLVIENGSAEENVEVTEAQSSVRETNDDSNSSTAERKEKRVKFDDKMNHELLIAELQNMKKEQERILKRQRKPSVDIYENNAEEAQHDLPKIQHSDWIEVNDGQEVHLSSCQITIDEDETNKVDTVDPLISRLNAMSNLHGLPPLPKSLSNFNFLDGSHTPNRGGRNVTPPSSGTGAGHLVYPPHPKGVVNGTGEINPPKKMSNLDAQLAILRREMYSLRQLDLTLLAQLWSLNESIQDFRQMLQDQDERVLSPPSPSPSPSSGDDGEADEFYTPSPMRFRPAPPPPPLRRPSNSSSGTSSV